MGTVLPVQERPSELIGGLLRELAEGARRARFEVAPNPCVGAAVLAGGQVIGRGFHEVWGGPHAEVAAIAAADQSGVPRSDWDLMVVTLEPCSSRGKTGPCVDAVLATGIRHVVVGAIDPDLRHAGRGIEALREAGVEVEFFASRPEAPGSWALEAVAPHFLRWTDHERLRRPRPWMVAKWAQTRTGQLSPPEDIGEGRWISGPASLAEVQLLRGRVDAIVTGIGTVQADDPRLSVRPPGDASRPPLRVVLDSYLTMGSETFGTRLLTPLDTVDAAAGREAAGKVLVFCLPGPKAERHRALTEAGAEVVTVPGDDEGRLSLCAIADDLWERGVRRALLEAGPTLTVVADEAEQRRRIGLAWVEAGGGGLGEQGRAQSAVLVGGHLLHTGPDAGDVAGREVDAHPHISAAFPTEPLGERPGIGAELLGQDVGEQLVGVGHSGGVALGGLSEPEGVDVKLEQLDGGGQQGVVAVDDVASAALHDHDVFELVAGLGLQLGVGQQHERGRPGHERHVAKGDDSTDPGHADRGTRADIAVFFRTPLAGGEEAAEGRALVVGGGGSGLGAGEAAHDGRCSSLRRRLRPAWSVRLSAPRG